MSWSTRRRVRNSSRRNSRKVLVFRTNNGKSKIAYKGYCYTLARGRRGHIYWTCEIKGCDGSVSTNSRFEVIHEKAHDSHGATDAVDKELEAAEDEEEDERGEWANPVEFILSCLGYAVGLGNVWRFPYLCYENGGGAFLVPYSIMLAFVGIPCLLIELSLGQFAAGGPITVWTVSPLFQGIGLSMLISSFIGCLYYNVIIGWSLYYLFASFTKELPWSHCGNKFNTDLCYSTTEASDCEDKNERNIFLASKCYTADEFDAAANFTNYTCQYYDEGFTYADELAKGNLNASEYNDRMPCTYERYIRERFWQRTGASEEYFNLGMLDRSDTMDEDDYVVWELTLVLLLAWILSYICVVKGIKSSGKAVYFTATFPYAVLISLFVRGILLKGALEGIKFYIIPKWEELLRPKVWADAAGQIFFSLTVGLGGLMTFASYNKYNNNIYRDTLILAIGNGFTSFFAGFAVFSILGHMAHTLGKDVKDVATSGSGLAFIAYPEVVTYLPASQVWSCLFFFMLITLGVDSQFAGLENLMTAVVDTYPNLRSKKWLVAAVICLTLYVMGIAMCTRAGFYWVELIGYYSSGWSLVLIGLAEAVVIGWFYPARRLKENIEEMVGFNLYPHWWFCWTFITPVLLIAILAFNIYDMTPLSVGDYELPKWAQSIGWTIAVATVAMIPVVALMVIFYSYRKPRYYRLCFFSRLLKLAQPTNEWLPESEQQPTQVEENHGIESGDEDDDSDDDDDDDEDSDGAPESTPHRVNNEEAPEQAPHRVNNGEASEQAPHRVSNGNAFKTRRNIVVPTQEQLRKFLSTDL